MGPSETALAAMMDYFSRTALAQVLITVLPIWVFGALVGLLLPRPRWMSSGSQASAVLHFTPAGTLFRRLALAYHGLVLLREVWYYWTAPGTFRMFLLATWHWICGKGFDFRWPTRVTEQALEAAEELSSASSASSWYVTEKDLAFFKYHAVEDGPTAGAGKWEIMLDKELPNVLRYQAWRRTLPNGKTEYKSVTICPDATAQEFIDMYFDDDFRPNWDSMVIKHEVLEHGDFSRRQQVVHWVRRFPFSFLSDRDYTIARQMFKEDDGSLYGITKTIEHPRSARGDGLVRMDTFYSMWRSRDVPDPWGGDRPACETVLLHHEQFKIPENLARFAVRHGMWGFVKQLSKCVPEFVAARRARGVKPHAVDDAGYGHSCEPNPPAGSLLRSRSSAASLTSVSSLASSEFSTDSDLDSARGGRRSSSSSGGGAGTKRSRRVKRIAAMALAGGIALLFGRGGGGSDAVAAAADKKQRGGSSHGARKARRHHKRAGAAAADVHTIHE